MPTPEPKESSYNAALAQELAGYITSLKNQYMKADEATKQATLDELTGWLVYEKGHRAYLKNNSLK